MAIINRDVSAAFDRTWIAGLQYKIAKLGLPTSEARVLISYLQDRTSQVRIDGWLGPNFPITAGVPQGGVLSPTLYNIYTADTPAPLHRNYNIIYADDVTQIINISGPSVRAVEVKIR